jgi:hypothetical protein
MNPFDAVWQGALRVYLHHILEAHGKDFGALFVSDLNAVIEAEVAVHDFGARHITGFRYRPLADRIDVGQLIAFRVEHRLVIVEMKKETRHGNAPTAENVRGKLLFRQIASLSRERSRLSLTMKRPKSWRGAAAGGRAVH